MQSSHMQVLNCFEAFENSFMEFVSSEQHSFADNGIQILMQDLKKIKDLFRELGMFAIVSVMDAVEAHTNVHFVENPTACVCVLSRLVSNNCYILAPSIFVHRNYNKFISTYWLITHAQYLEKQRRDTNCKKQNVKTKVGIVIESNHLKIYHDSFTNVFKQLNEMYEFMKVQYQDQKKIIYSEK